MEVVEEQELTEVEVDVQKLNQVVKEEEDKWQKRNQQKESLGKN